MFKLPIFWGKKKKKCSVYINVLMFIFMLICLYSYSLLHSYTHIHILFASLHKATNPKILLGAPTPPQIPHLYFEQTKLACQCLAMLCSFQYAIFTQSLTNTGLFLPLE